MLSQLNTRLSVVDATLDTVQRNFPLHDAGTGVQRCAAAVMASGYVGCALYQVPAGYYDKALAQRAAVLDCPVERLCKTLVLVNEAVKDATFIVDKPLGQQRFIAIVIQYNSKLDAPALERALKLSHGGDSDLKLRAAGDAPDFTGFQFNAVTPFGSKRPLPIVVTKPIATLPAPAFVWLGGGAVDVKLRMFVPQLLRRDPVTGVTPVVLDVAVPRDADEEDA